MMNSEKSPELHNPKEINLRQFRRMVYEDFLEGLEQREKSGSISTGERWNIVARALLRRDEEVETVRRTAETDPLTGVPNRRAFNKAYRKLIKSGQRFGLLIVDIDYFKKINDEYGHPVGDSALIQIGLMLESGIRTLHSGEPKKDVVTRTGTIGRIGGEEFAIILPGVNEVSDLYNIAERVRGIISDSPLQVRTQDKKIQLPVTVSVGGGLYRGGEAEAFFAKVDKALYTAKKQRNDSVINITEQKEKAA